MADNQVVVEVQVEYPVSCGDQSKRTDVVRESLQNLGRYPSGPQRMASRDTVFDPDIQLFGAALSRVAAVVHYWFSCCSASPALCRRAPCGPNRQRRPLPSRTSLCPAGVARSSVTPQNIRPRERPCQTSRSRPGGPKCLPIPPPWRSLSRRSDTRTLLERLDRGGL